jgi:hypothetical protein
MQIFCMGQNLGRSCQVEGKYLYLDMDFDFRFGITLSFSYLSVL